MDSVSGSLKQSEPCSPLSPASPDPTLDKRPTSPQTISKALNSLQRGKKLNRFFKILYFVIKIVVYVEFVHDTFHICFTNVM